MNNVNLFCLLVVVIVPGLFCQTDPEQLIDEIVAAGLGCHKTPGLAIAVVKDGAVVLSKGYGLADMSDPFSSVTSQTLFGISSNTKAFTTTLLVKLLAARSDLKISTNVYRVLGSGFKFNNTLRSIYATLEDLAAHRLGIPRNNYLRLDTSLTREDLERRVKYLKSVGGFRDSFYYSDLMYGLLTDIIEKLGGSLWEDQIESEIFNPLYMVSSTFGTRVNFSSANVAKPYVVEHGVLEEASHDFIRHWALIGGSGSILSNADDMAKWLLFHLNDGKNEDGYQVVPKNALADTYKPRNSITSFSTINKYFQRPVIPVTTSNDGYCLGWKSGYYRGLPIIQHTGSTFGYRSIATLIPSKKLGIFIVMTGSDPKYFFRTTLQDYIADLYLGETAWLNTSTICTFPSPWRSSRRRRTIKRSARSNLENYSGIYRNEAYGNIYVTYSSNKLHAVYGYGEWDLASSGGDNFDGSWTRGAPYLDTEFNFLHSYYNRIYALKMPKFEKRSVPVFFRIGNTYGNNVVG